MKTRLTIPSRKFLRLIWGAGFFCLALMISAQTLWEGSAAVGAYGVLPVKGLYGASNSFPRNTLVEVENLENGRKTEILIVDRLENSSFLVLLSQEAGAALNMNTGNVIRVRANLGQEEKTDSYSLTGEQAFHPDPDVNPAVSAGRSDGISSEDTDTLLALSRYPGTDEEKTVRSPEIPVVEAPEITPEDTVPEPEPETPAEPDATPVPDTTPEPKIKPKPEPEIVEIPDTAEEPADLVIEDSLDRETEEPDKTPLEPVETPEPVEERIIDVVSGWNTPRVEGDAAIRDLALPGEPESVESFPDEPSGPVLVDTGTDYQPPRSADSSRLAQDPALPSEPEPRRTEIPLQQGPALVDAESISLVSPPAGEKVPLPEDLPPEPELALWEEETPEVINGYSVWKEGEEEALAMDSPEIQEPRVEPPENIAVEVVPEEEPEVVVQVPEEPVEEAETTPEPTEEIQPEFPEPSPDVELVLEPADQRPPVVTEEPEDAMAAPEEVIVPELVEAGPVETDREEEPKTESPGPASAPVDSPAEVPLVKQLENGFHYIQVGVFRSRTSVSAAVARLEPGYPVVIWSPGEDTPEGYKVMIGPLTADESGALLYNFRASGYGDAFVRKM